MRGAQDSASGGAPLQNRRGGCGPAACTVTTMGGELVADLLADVPELLRRRALGLVHGVLDLGPGGQLPHLLLDLRVGLTAELRPEQEPHGHSEQEYQLLHGSRRLSGLRCASWS